MAKSFSCSAILPFLTILYFLTNSSNGYIQVLQIHESSGSFYEFRRNNPDLGPLLDYVYYPKFCFRGSWTVFFSENYTTKANDFNNPSEQLSCHESNFSLYRSFRHIGNIDTDRDSLSLYTDENYQGEEILVEAPEVAGIHESVKSLGYTGHTGWTLFEGKFFDGKSACLRAQAPGKGVEHVENLHRGLNLTTVGSLYKGCDDIVDESYVRSVQLLWEKTRRQQK